MAELFGVTTALITRWETGKSMPHNSSIRQRVNLWIDSHYPNPTLDPTLTDSPSIYKEGKEDEEGGSEPAKPRHNRPFIPSRY